MNPFRRSFLRLLATGGAVAASAPTFARADRIRVLPDGDGAGRTLLGTGRSAELGRALGGLTLGPAVVQGGLAVLWLHAKDTAGGPPLEILTLDESRASGVLTVIERAQASVPDLIAENRGKAYVLLLAGEILIGGKQNRVLREDLLMPPHSGPRNIGVYCVEQGRWNEGRKDFDSRGSVVQPSVRSQVLRKEPQSRVWSGVASASRDLRAPSATGSYQAIYDKPEVKAQLEQTTRRFDPAGAAAVGAVAFVGSSLAGVDCFHSPGLFAREWPKLLRAYALDAYGAKPGAWDESAARARTDGLLRAAARVEGALRESVGAGRLFEFTLDGRRGAALLFEGQAIHVALL